MSQNHLENSIMFQGDLNDLKDQYTKTDCSWITKT